VIDDEEIDRRTLKTLLEAEGLDVVTAASGEEGVALLRGRQFEVAIADLMMPGMDGLQVIAALKAVDPDIEVILQTGYATVDSTIAAFRQGAGDYLLKPIDKAKLRPALLRALAMRRPHAALPLYEASRPLLAAQNREDLIPAILALAKSTMRASAVGLALVPTEGAGLRIHLSNGHGPLTEAAAESLAQITLRAGESLRNPCFGASQSPSGDTGIPPGSILTYPLEVQNATPGALVLWRDQGRAQFSAFDVGCGRLLADEIIIALDNARLYRELSHKVEELESARVEVARVEAGAHAVIATAQEAIVLFDKKGVVRDINPKALEMFGRTRDETLGRNLADFALPTRVLDGFRQHVETAYREGRDPADGSMEIIALRKNGEEFPLEISTVVIETPQGKQLSTFARDITERKRAEAEVAERHRLATLVADVGVVVTRAESLRQGLQQCAEILVHNIGAAFARVWTVKEVENVLELQASAGMYTHIDGGHARVPLGKFKIGRIAESGEPHLTNSVQQDSWVGDPEWAQREGMMAFAGYPLKVEERVLGVVAAFARQPLTEATLQAFAAVADNIAQFIKRKRAEEALRTSEERYRLLFERNLAGVFRGTLLNRKLLECNDAYARILGYKTRQEALNNGKLHDFYDAAEFESVKTRLLNQKALTNYEIRFRRKDQTPVWLLANASLITSGEGEDPVIEGMIFDITERKRAEQALAKERDLLHALMNNVPDCIYFKDRAGRFIRASMALARLFGLRDCAELVGKTDFDFFTAEHAQPAYDDEQEVIRTGKPMEAKVEKETWPDGRVTWASTTKVPLREDAGNIVGTFGISRDVTEQKRAEEALRESEEKYRVLYESSRDAMMTLAPPEWKFTAGNPAAIALYGARDEREFVTAGPGSLSPEYQPDGELSSVKARRMIATAMERGSHFFEWAHRKFSGEEFFTTVLLTRMTYRGQPFLQATVRDITEHRRAEQALQERTAYLNALFEISPLGIAVLDTQGSIQMSNSSFEKLFLYSREEIFGANLDDLIVPPELASEASTLTRLCLGGGGVQATTRRRRKDGQLIDAEVYGVPLVIDGELRGYLCLYQDITERKRAEAELVKYAEDLEISQAVQEEHAKELARLVEELAQERDLLGTVMDNLPDYIYYKDRQSRFLRANPAHAKALGLSDPHQTVGKTDLDFFPEEDAKKYFSDEQQVIETGQALLGRMERVRHPDGQYHWFSTSKVPIRDTQGHVTGLVGISRDMTEQMRAEETLRASEVRYRELFENASDIVYTTGLDTRLTSLNRVGQKILGYSAEEATELDLRQLVTAKHWELIKLSGERLMAGASDIAIEVEITTKDGRQMTLEVKPRLIYKGGKPVGVQGIARDITGRDTAEMELRHAQKLEAVGRLASGIAHEINTPIQFVGDNTRFLQDSFGGLQTLLSKYQELRDAADSGVVSPEMLAAVRNAEEESDCAYLREEIPKALAQTLEGVTRVATIVRAMKEFAHPEGKEMAAADLNRALLSTLTVARNELKYVADIETDLGDLPLVVCNLGDLNQVFLNLLVNAAHAVGEVVQGTGERGKIRVCTCREEGTVLIAIRDTGGGIPEAIRGRIFDPFFTTKEVGRGTGQGLAIARSVVVDRHKGALTFETEVGKGTTFYVRLPLDPAECSKEAKG
jgi:PAS domain S-box-containing protein